MNFFVYELFRNPTFFICTVIVVGFSVCIHEFCHAWVALKLGDPTAADAGHLTLNPLKQMGIWSIVMLLVFGFCWGAVPVNPARVSRRRSAFIALAGPLANLLLFVVFLLLCAAAVYFKSDGAALVGYCGARINLVLFFINLVPVPGFDGGAVLLNLFPAARWRDNELVKGMMIGAILLIFMGAGYLFEAADYLTRIGLNALFGVLKL